MSSNHDTEPSVARYGLIALTPLLPWLVFLPAGRWLLPWIAPLTLLPAFLPLVRARRYGRAWCAGMVWTVLLSAGVIALVHQAPATAADGILNGEAYRLEMFGWIETGVGRETAPSQFLPEHALHLTVFALLAAISGGYLGLVLGAILVAYMSYFVGSYAVSAERLWTGSLAAWVPWSVVRVAAFVLLGSVLARPLLERRWWPFGKTEAGWVSLALLGIGTDITLKILLAPGYGLFLRRLAGGVFGGVGDVGDS